MRQNGVPEEICPAPDPPPARSFTLPLPVVCGTFSATMKAPLILRVATLALILTAPSGLAQSARQLTRRVVPPANNPPPAGGAPASKPAPAPRTVAPTTNNTAVPAPPRPADAEKAKQETLRKTIEFQKKRAAEGSPSAQYELGLRYLTGDGMEQDEATGRKWLEDSAKQDYTPAKRKLEELKDRKKK
jgi:TPR repeat protein